MDSSTSEGRILNLVSYINRLQKCTFTQVRNSGLKGSSFSSAFINDVNFEKAFFTDSGSLVFVGIYPRNILLATSRAKSRLS